MKFKQLAVDTVFFENLTGEYYVKKSENFSLVYDYNKQEIYSNRDGFIECEFPPEHQVEVEER